MSEVLSDHRHGEIRKPQLKDKMKDEKSIRKGSLAGSEGESHETSPKLKPQGVFLGSGAGTAGLIKSVRILRRQAFLSSVM